MASSDGQKTPKITRDMLCVPVPDSAFDDVTQLFYVGSTPRDSVSTSMASLDTPATAGHRTSRVDSVALEMDYNGNEEDEQDTKPTGVASVESGSGPICKQDAFVNVDEISGNCQHGHGSVATPVVPMDAFSSEEVSNGGGLDTATVARHRNLERLDSAKLLNQSRIQRPPGGEVSKAIEDIANDSPDEEGTACQGPSEINWNQVVPESRVLSGVARQPLPSPSVSDHPPRHDSKKGPGPGPALDRLQSTVSGTSTVFGSDEHTCRICWWGEERESCIQPCHCSGSSAYVHPSCLQKWLQVTNVYQCEICTYEFKTRKRTKPLSQWTWRMSKTRQMSQLEATLILLSIVTPPLVCGIVLCGQKISEYLANDEHAWKTAALMTLIMASIITYLVAVVYFCRKVNLVCRAWMSINQRLVVSLAHSNLEIEVPQMDNQPHVWSIS